MVLHCGYRQTATALVLRTPAPHWCRQGSLWSARKPPARQNDRTAKTDVFEEGWPRFHPGSFQAIIYCFTSHVRSRGETSRIAMTLNTQSPNSRAVNPLEQVGQLVVLNNCAVDSSAVQLALWLCTCAAACSRAQQAAATPARTPRQISLMSVTRPWRWLPVHVLRPLTRTCRAGLGTCMHGCAIQHCAGKLSSAGNFPWREAGACACLSDLKPPALCPGACMARTSPAVHCLAAGAVRMASAQHACVAALAGWGILHSRAACVSYRRGPAILMETRAVHEAGACSCRRVFMARAGHV